MFAYAEPKLLRKVTGSTGNVISPPSAGGRTVYAIPAGGYSEIISCGGDAKELIFDFQFATIDPGPAPTGPDDDGAIPAPGTGDLVIEKCSNETASNDGEEFATVTVAAEDQAEWHSGEPLSGHYRVQNGTSESVFVYAQKLID